MDLEQAPLARTVFLLSPARTDGRRGQLVFSASATFPLAVRLREGVASIGETFSFLSGLYFRGKLAYATTFARTHGAAESVLVIVPGLGLAAPEAPITLEGLRAVGAVGVDPAKAAFVEPLERDAARLGASLEEADRVVLLGSIATGKYVDALSRHLGRRLVFPAEFVGRGDMSRGGLMLRCVAEGRELEYIEIEGSVRRGPRPPRLERIR